MSRVKLKNLLLINWRGLFFQSIDMDATITSLTGQNGAGKTTIMAAAYVALLPDQSLLDLRNQAGSGVSSKKQGLYGRFGKGGVCYSVLELVGAKGERVFAGVQIRKKTEPDFELIPFIITGFHPEVTPEDIFLKRDGDDDVIIDSTTSQGMLELEALCKHYNAKIRTFKGRVGEYMSLLYELGLTPLRLAKTGERKKFNKLLQTSLFGGLSGEIQQSLKEYLLDKDATLSNQVTRAEQNLSTCKQTRETIERTEQSRKCIESLLKSSTEMASSIWQGSYLKRLKGQKETLQSRQEWNLERKKLQQINVQLLRKNESLALKESVTSSLREAIEKIRREIEIRRESMRISAQITKTLSEITSYEEKKQATARELSEVEGKVERFTAEEKKIDEMLSAIMKQLFDTSEALTGEARQQGLYKAAASAKEEFEKEFPEGPKDTESLKVDLETRNRELSEELWRLNEWKDKIKRVKSKFEETFALVERLYIVDPGLFPSAPGRRPDLIDDLRSVIAEWNQLEAKTRMIENLRTERDLLKSKCEKWREIRSIAQPFGIQSEDDFATHLSELAERNAILRRDLKDLQSKQSQVLEKQKLLATRRAELVLGARNWDKTNLAAREINHSLGAIISQSSNLLEIRASVFEKREKIYEKKYELVRERQELLDLLSQLQIARVLTDDKLIDAAGQIGGDLICDVYDNLDIVSARRKEAEIGPLRHAIHVEDPQSSVEDFLALEDKPDEVWLVNHHDLKHQLRTREAGDWVVSHWGQAIRIAKQPKNPLLGAEAREKEIARIEARLAKFSDDLAELEVQLAQLAQTEKTLSTIEEHVDLIGENDPRSLISEVDGESESLDSMSDGIAQQIKVLKDDLFEGESGESTLKKLEIWSVLLDEKDLEASLARMEEVLLGLLETKTRLQATSSLMIKLQDRLADLEIPQSLDEADLDLKLTVKEKEKMAIGKSLLVIGNYLDLKEHLERKPTIAEPSQGQKIQDSLRREKEVLEEKKKALRLELAPMVDQKFNLISLKQSSELMLSRLSSELVELRSSAAFNISGSTEELDEKYSLMRDELSKAEAELTEVKVEVRGLEVDEKVSRNQCEKLLNSYKSSRKEQWSKAADSWKSLKKLQISHRCFDKIVAVATDFAQMDLTEIAACAGRASAELKKALTEQRQGSRSEASGLFERINTLSGKSLLENAVEVLLLYKDIQGYLEQILPRDIVTSDDPLHALEELEDHIRRLTARLKHHEQDFAVSAYDVAHGIEQKIRKEFRNLARLNEGLDTIKFGAIRAVRIRYGKKPGMEALLETMLDQKANQLFARDSGLTFEEALAKLYESQIGRAFTGDSLLDFRHYIDLQIQIRRVGRDNWESADSNRLSTGESIGVGLAILIMVLQSWELHTSRLTGKKRDSLRFLFLDEASRLDSSSINTLAGLCRDMDLQLLIAAPLADQAVSGTTYALTRLVDEVYGEQVILRGLRGFGNKVEYKDINIAPVQVSLWTSSEEASGDSL